MVRLVDREGMANYGRRERPMFWLIDKAKVIDKVYLWFVDGNGNREGGKVEGLAVDGVIRNFRSDGPADYIPYGMGDRNFVAGRL